MDEHPDITGCCKFMFFFDGAVADQDALEKKGEVAFAALDPAIEFVVARLSYFSPDILSPPDQKQFRFSVYLRSEMAHRRLLNLVLDTFLQLVPSAGDTWNLRFLSKEEEAANIQRVKDAILEAAAKFA